MAAPTPAEERRQAVGFATCRVLPRSAAFCRVLCYIAQVLHYAAGLLHQLLVMPCIVIFRSGNGRADIVSLAIEQDTCTIQVLTSFQIWKELADSCTIRWRDFKKNHLPRQYVVFIDNCFDLGYLWILFAQARKPGDSTHRLVWPLRCNRLRPLFLAPARLMMGTCSAEGPGDQRKP